MDRTSPKEPAMPFGLHTKDTPGKGRILILDDEDNIRKILRLTLTKAGYDVVEADHGGKGIEAIRADDIMLMVDVIITDIRMPKVNGLEAIAFFQSQFPSVQIIVLTGYPEAQMAADLMNAGVVDYLVKPVVQEKLLATVETAMERRTALKHDH
jgi:two-component system chemotaxis response regulator CheY